MNEEFPLSASSRSYLNNESFLRGVLERFGPFTKRRPKRFYEALLRFLVPGEVRRIVRLETGLIYYVNPLNHIGRHILERGAYETHNLEMFRRHIRPGDVVLDVGANEGFFTAFFGLLTGRAGHLIAVEPQSRLCDLIEVNCRLNGIVNCHIFQRALGLSGTAPANLALYSTINTGMSSLVARYRSTIGYEKVSFVTIDEVMNQSGVDHIDVVKVDTEGFEPEIVQGMIDALKRGAIGKLCIDYHDAILRSRGLTRRNLHDLLVDAGMVLVENPTEAVGGYTVYASSPSE